MPPIPGFEPQIKTWIRSNGPESVYSKGPEVASKIWFKSDPITRDFCYRLTQLQLVTKSQDQGSINDKSKGNWTWFDIVIFPDSKDETLRKDKDGKELIYRSHNNQLANKQLSLHFGKVFDRRSDLLANLEVGS